MKNRNIYRIYDCGTITYFLNLFWKVLVIKYFFLYSHIAII
jgi:hypothetical protein